jgi:hypothetical protein
MKEPLTMDWWGGPGWHEGWVRVYVGDRILLQADVKCKDLPYWREGSTEKLNARFLKMFNELLVLVGRCSCNVRGCHGS